MFYLHKGLNVNNIEFGLGFPDVSGAPYRMLFRFALSNLKRCCYVPSWRDFEKPTGKAESRHESQKTRIPTCLNRVRYETPREKLDIRADLNIPLNPSI